MAPVNLTINGRAVQATAGQTVLQAATEAGVFIPTLCHHPALEAHGGCRMCLVEIEKQRTLQPACTFPVAAGLVIQTESPRVVKARRFVLHMLFSERLHYCMYCSSSGGEHTSDCELQRLAYRYGLTCWDYAPNSHVRWPVDASRTHFVMDHNRCILCRRCVRACNELVANHTLGVHQRGARTMVCADDDRPMGESSCVSCGTCLQVCPTGAVMDRRSAFMGHAADVQRTRTTCMGCAVGCAIETVTRSGRLLRVEGVWSAANRGVLCVDGRFGVLDDTPPRLRHPLIRRDGELVECSWDEALTVAAQRLLAARSVAGLITSRSTNQSLKAFRHLFHDLLRSDELSLLHARVPPLDVGPPAGLPEVAQADCIVVLGADPLEHQKVLGYAVRRAQDHGARLIVAEETASPLMELADVTFRLQPDGGPRGGGPIEALRRISHLQPDRLAQVKEAVEQAQRPVVLYADGLGPEIYAALRALPGKTRFVPLVEGANALGAARLGLGVKPIHGEALYVVASDEHPGEHAALPEASFTLVQSSYRNGWVGRADVALPSKIWFEKQGHTTNLEGRRLTLTRSADAPSELLSDWATMFLLSVKMGRPLTCITVAEEAVEVKR